VLQCANPSYYIRVWSWGLPAQSLALVGRKYSMQVECQYSQCRAPHFYIAGHGDIIALRAQNRFHRIAGHFD
jgi:hypothetical protein